MSQLSVLKRRRQELNMTQAQVAMATGVSQPTYQNYEAGTITIPTANLNRLARVLKMTTDEILGSPKVVALPPPIKPKPPTNERDTRDEDDFYPADYWGDIAVHFAKGEPIVLAISEDEHSRLYSAVQRDEEFFHVYSMSNQIVGLRRAAVTDLSFAHEAGGTCGLEHDYYKERRLVTGAWVGTHETWRIIEALIDESAIDTQEIVDLFGRTRVDRIAEKFGVDILENVHEPVEGEQVKIGEGQYSESRIALATELACNVKWQLSNGKVRQEPIIYREELARFSWLAEPGPGNDTFFGINDDIAVWINANTLDYISVPAHSFLEEQKKALDKLQMRRAAGKKKKRGS
jgi:transcriptional regulator with XRE-family HTH domain